MGVSLECSCGQYLTVEATQAGEVLRCSCGAEIRVPSLSKLRELAGKRAYESGTIDIIHGMLLRGELPTGDRCAICGEATGDVVDLHVEAERVYAGNNHSAYAWLGMLISPIFLLGLFQKPRPAVGRETIVPTPLRVASPHHPRVRRSGQRSLKRWLRTVPIYAKLLEEYPRARVRVGGTVSPRGG